MYVFASMMMVFVVFMLVAGIWGNIYSIRNGKAIYPWVDGLTAAYIVVYFLWIYKG